jgi:hypothetical protein
MLASEEQQKYRRLIHMPGVKFISNVFRHSKELKNIVYEKRNDECKGKSLIPGGGFISSPTENKAIRNMSLITYARCEDGFWVKYPEKWLLVIEYAMCICPDSTTRTAVNMWQCGYNANYIAKSTGLSRSSYYDIRKEVQHYAIAIAAQMRLIDVLKIERSIENGAGENHQEKNHEE